MPASEGRQPAISGSGEPPQRICLIRPSALGDVCRTVPVLVSLRRAFPEAEIDWLVQSNFVPAVVAHPALTRIISFPRSEFARAATNPAVLRRFVEWTRALRKRSYDRVYDCQGLARSGFFAWCTRAPRRVGFRNAREGGFFGYTHRYRIDTKLHTVDRMLGLIAADGVQPVCDLRLYVAESDRKSWESIRRQHHVQHDARYAVLAPTSRWPSKQWPDDRFAAIVDPLLDRGFTHIVLVGSQAERSQCERVLARCDGRRVIDLLGSTTVGTLMAVVADASLVVANDSAPLHMAVGFGRRYIALFGPTDVQRVGPYRGERWVVQKAAPVNHSSHKDPDRGSIMMQQITVNDVLGKLEELLSEFPLSCPPEDIR